jgi:hypothetical protein
MSRSATKTPRPDFHVVLQPTDTEWVAYDIVDPEGRTVDVEFDLGRALAVAQSLNEQHPTKAAA